MMTITASDMDFTVFCIFDHPAQAVFEALADPAQLSQHFTMGGAQGRMATGATVTWEFADFPGSFDVTVIEAIPARSLIFDWPHPTGPGANRVTFAFDAFAPGLSFFFDAHLDFFEEIANRLAARCGGSARRLRKRDGMELYAGRHAHLAGSRHRHATGHVPLTA